MQPEGHHDYGTTWWQAIRFPLRLEQTATYAHLATTRQAVLRCLVLALLMACASIAIGEVKLRLLWAELARAGLFLNWEDWVQRCVLVSVLEDCAWFLGLFAVVTAATVCAIHIKLRRRRTRGEAQTAARAGKMDIAIKAAAASFPAFVWLATVVALLSIAGVILVPPHLIVKGYVFWPVFIGILGLLATAFLWPLIMSVRCGLRITDHLLRVRCVACGYDLRGTPGDRCSECGMALQEGLGTSLDL